MKVCQGCKQGREIVTSEVGGLEYCVDCAASLPMPTVARAMGYLTATIPFRVGDRVECRLAGEILEGVGTVQEVSFDLENGGTPVYPAFRVVLDEKAYKEAPDEEWATEICLRKVDE